MERLQEEEEAAKLGMEERMKKQEQAQKDREERIRQKMIQEQERQDQLKQQQAQQQEAAKKVVKKQPAQKAPVQVEKPGLPTVELKHKPKQQQQTEAKKQPQKPQLKHVEKAQEEVEVKDEAPWQGEAQLKHVEKVAQDEEVPVITSPGPEDEDEFVDAQESLEQVSDDIDSPSFIHMNQEKRMHSTFALNIGIWFTMEIC